MKLEVTWEGDTDTLCHELTDQLDRDELMQFIIALDLAVAEVEFTQHLIEKLQKSLDED